jgi:hypothetical protein
VKLKEAITAAGQKKGPACAIGAIRLDLSKADLADLDECLADRAFTHAQITRGLASEGFKVNSSTVARHRQHECACAQ